MFMGLVLVNYNKLLSFAETEKMICDSIST